MRVTREMVLEKLKEVYDPEIPFVNIVDLGLIYSVEVNEQNDVYIKMTLTAPGCPLASFIVEYVKRAVKEIEGVRNVDVELVFDPPWTPDRMSEKARKMLGLG